MEKLVTIKGKQFPAKISGDSIVIVDGEKEHVLLRCPGEVAYGSGRIPRIQAKFKRMEKLFPQYFPKSKEPDDDESADEPEKPKAGRKSGKKKTKKTGTK